MKVGSTTYRIFAAVVTAAGWALIIIYGGWLLALGIFLAMWGDNLADEL